MKIIKIIMLYIVLQTLPLFGEEFFVEQYNYSVYIPEGWNVLDSTNLAELSFMSDDQTIVSQISSFEGSDYSSSKEMYEKLAGEFKLESDGTPFLYNGDDSFIADITFKNNDDSMRGWFLFINRKDRDYYILTFSSAEYYEKKLSFILSVLDSFRIEEKNNKVKPGAISQFYYPFPGTGKDRAQMQIHGKKINFQTDLNEFEASQLVIEREADLMKYYQDLGDKPLFEEAWRRYYRVIYRDNYMRFENMAKSLKDANIGENDIEKSKSILNWIQNFEYTRIDTFSDLLSPISAASHEKGDCDARGLAYSIILKHLEIDSILMVSWQYKHSMSAVSIAGEGARIPFENETYLVAETTEVIDMGMIPQNMADGDKWIPISFNNP